MRLTCGNSTLIIHYDSPLGALPPHEYCKIDPEAWVFTNSYINYHIKDKDENVFYKNWIHGICTDMRDKDLYLNIRSEKICYWADGAGPYPKANKVKHATEIYHYYITIFL